MKTNFIPFLFSTIAIILGFSSCKKDNEDTSFTFEDCEDCFSVTNVENDCTYVYCERSFHSRAEYEYYLNEYTIYYGIDNVTQFKGCEDY